MENKKENNFAYIDSQNLNLGVKDMGWVLDTKRFRVYLKEKYGVSKAYIFIGFVPGNQNLYDALQEYGYVLVFKPVVLGFWFKHISFFRSTGRGVCNFFGDTGNARMALWYASRPHICVSSHSSSCISSYAVRQVFGDPAGQSGNPVGACRGGYPSVCTQVFFP